MGYEPRTGARTGRRGSAARSWSISAASTVASCQLMDQRVLPKSDVVKLLEKFVTVKLYTDFVPINSITPAQRDALGKSQSGAT